MLGNHKTLPKKKVTRVESSLSRFLIFSIASLSFFAILNTLLGLYALASIQGFIAILLPLLYIWLKHGGSQTFIKHSIGFATLTVFAPLLFFPSADNTGIYWIFLYPLVAPSPTSNISLYITLRAKSHSAWLSFFFAA